MAGKVIVDGTRVYIEGLCHETCDEDSLVLIPIVTDMDCMEPDDETTRFEFSVTVVSGGEKYALTVPIGKLQEALEKAKQIAHAFYTTDYAVRKL